MQRLIFSLVLLATAAQADMITQTINMADWAGTQAQWGNSVSLPFHRFNPGLGQLTGVQIWASADVGVHFADWPAEAPDWVILQDTLSTLLGSAYQAYTYTRFPGAPTSPVDTSLKISESGMVNQNLASYIGLDWWSLAVSGNVFVYLQSPSSAAIPPGVLSLRNLSLEIGYQYTPAVAAPEPHYTSVALTGMTILALVARRRIWSR